MKTKKMVLVIRKKKNVTEYERIGDDLSTELRSMVYREIEGELSRHKVI